MKLNVSKEWLRQRAELDDKAEVSAGVLHFSRLNATASRVVTSIRSPIEPETPHPAFGRLINLLRRQRGLHIDTLAEKAKIEAAELIEIEDNPHYIPEPRTVYQLATTLELPTNRMLELSGNLTVRDPRLGQEAVRFAARSESVEKLSKDEQMALEEFVKFLSEK